MIAQKVEQTLFPCWRLELGSRLLASALVAVKTKIIDGRSLSSPSLTSFQIN